MTFMISIPVLMLAGLVLLALALWANWRLFHPGWMGFSEKTLWNWLGLLAVPLTLGFGTLLINDTQARISAERAAEAQLQAFVDRMTALTVDRADHADQETVNAIGRAQTQAMLRQVNGERAGRVVAFLSDLGLLHRFDVSFEGRDLRRAELKDADLAAVDFEGTILRGADLERAVLIGADFEAADLRGADFKAADMRNTSFEATLMGNADLDHADLRGADLSLADGLKDDQVALACLDETTILPDDLDVGDISGPTEGCFGEPDD